MEHPFEDSAKLRILNAKYTIPESDTKYTVFHDLISKYYDHCISDYMLCQDTETQGFVKCQQSAKKLATSEFDLVKRLHVQ